MEAVPNLNKTHLSNSNTAKVKREFLLESKKSKEQKLCGIGAFVSFKESSSSIQTAVYSVCPSAVIKADLQILKDTALHDRSGAEEQADTGGWRGPGRLVGSNQVVLLSIRGGRTTKGSRVLSAITLSLYVLLLFSSLTLSFCANDTCTGAVPVVHVYLEYFYSHLVILFSKFHINMENRSLQMWLQLKVSAMRTVTDQNPAFGVTVRDGSACQPNTAQRG